MIFIIKLVIFIERLIAAFFVNIVFKLGWIILRFIFYKVVVKVYRLYLFIVKRLDWASSNRAKVSGPILTHQKSVHFIVIILTITLVFINLTNRTRAQSLVGEAENTILDDLVKGEFSSQEEEELIEEFFDQETTIIPNQQFYLDNLAFLKSQPAIDINEIEEEEREITAIIQDGTAMVKPGIATTKKTKRPRTEIVYHTVKPGDTVSTIAAEFEVSVNTILWENNLSAYSLIRPGNRLAILPVSGVSHKVVSGETIESITKKYNVEGEKILAVNNLEDINKLKTGQKLIIPGGKKIQYAQYVSKGYSGLEVLKDLVKPVGARPAPGNKMNWPTDGHRITQYYSLIHRGIDIANKEGTPIYAADTGIVEYIGWDRGYGNQIVINHGAGKKTRYAHLSKFYVKKGQEVNKGESIATMGSTGWSTGTHLHFEVIIDGRKYNPLSYIK